MASPQAKVYTEDGRVISVDVWSNGAWRAADFEEVGQWGPHPFDEPTILWDRLAE